MAVDELSRRVALVTGGRRGIGAAVAQALAASSATVVISGRDGPDGRRAAKSMTQATGADVRWVDMDVTSESSVQQAVDEVGQIAGRIDVLVNNAGVAATHPTADLALDDWNRHLAVNLTGAFLVSRASFELLCTPSDGAVIVNMGSVAGLRGQAQVAAYAAAKGGLLAFTRALAVEWARHAIRVVAVAPGYVETDFNREVLGDEAIADKLLRRTPLRRFSQPEEVATLVAYLASRDASFVTGSVHLIDGGWCAA